MKSTILFAIFFLSSTLSYAGSFPDESKSVCKSLAEKTAETLLSLETTDQDRRTMDIVLTKTENSSTSQWQVTFVLSGEAADEDNELGVIYYIDVINYGTSESEACFLENVEILRAG